MSETFFELVLPQEMTGRFGIKTQTILQIDGLFSPRSVANKCFKDGLGFSAGVRCEVSCNVDWPKGMFGSSPSWSCLRK